MLRLASSRNFQLLPLTAAVASAIAATPQAMAQDDSLTLEEVIVTARKRTESVQDIPASIQAISGADLREMGARGVEDFTRFMPSVNMISYGNGSSSIIFRGATIDGGGYVAQSTASVYLDEISITSVGSQPSVRMVDIAQVESLAIAVPPLALDLVAGSEFWQSFFATPLTGPRWDTQSPMYYRSMIQEALPGKGALLGRAIFAEACRLWAARGGPACMSLGVVGPGKLADEASYKTPAELAWDVACATAAGLDDLALFSLESVLEREHPGQWLDAFTQPAVAPLASVGERVARTSVRGLLQVTGGLTRWL